MSNALQRPMFGMRCLFMNFEAPACRPGATGRPAQALLDNRRVEGLRRLVRDRAAGRALQEERRYPELGRP